jgi:3-hydroxyisobutyrate dehydrogenase-like beta-hydroxyacid dehydrogenase
MKLGCIGLGRTAPNLIEAGREVSVYNRTPD